MLFRSKLDTTTVHRHEEYFREIIISRWICPEISMKTVNFMNRIDVKLEQEISSTWKIFGLIGYCWAWKSWKQNNLFEVTGLIQFRRSSEPWTRNNLAGIVGLIEFYRPSKSWKENNLFEITGLIQFCISSEPWRKNNLFEMSKDNRILWIIKTMKVDTILQIIKNINEK